MASGGEFFRDAEGGEGLAGVAGHDELAAVCFFQSRKHVFDGFVLVGAWSFAFAEGEVLRALGVELRPVHGAVVEVLDSEAGDGFGLVGKGVLALVPHLSVVETIMQEVKKDFLEVVKKESMSPFASVWSGR